MLNIGLHCVISVLMIDVFAVLIAGVACDGKAKRLAHPPKASVLAAMLFAAHPVHTESVSKEEEEGMAQQASSSSTYCKHTTIALPYGHGIKHTLKSPTQLVCVSKVCSGAVQLC